MAMLVPRRSRSLFDELMTDPFDAFFGSVPSGKPVSNLMRTDIREHDGGYELEVDLPGLSKDDVHVELKDGCLNIEAEAHSHEEQKDEKGAYIRKERFDGKCSRTFYVGEDIEEDDIKAKFNNGVLSISVPKKQPEPVVENKKTIAIEG